MTIEIVRYIPDIKDNLKIQDEEKIAGDKTKIIEFVKKICKSI